MVMPPGLKAFLYSCLERCKGRLIRVEVDVLVSITKKEGSWERPETQLQSEQLCGQPPLNWFTGALCPEVSFYFFPFLISLVFVSHFSRYLFGTAGAVGLLCIVLLVYCHCNSSFACFGASIRPTH